MCVKFRIPVRGVSSFMDSSAGIGVGKCVRKTEYRIWNKVKKHKN